MVSNKKIRAMFIFEILGRPPKHVKETMGQLIDKLNELQDIEVSNRTIHDPKPVEDEKVKDLFTAFAEVEILAGNLNALLNIVFHAMPSHVEILEPDELTLKNFDLSSTLSTLTVKLHRYDEIAKTLTIERNILMNKLKELKPNLSAEDFKIKQEDKKEIKKGKSKKKTNKSKKK